MIEGRRRRNSALSVWQPQRGVKTESRYDIHAFGQAVLH